MHQNSLRAHKLVAGTEKAAVNVCLPLSSGSITSEDAHYSYHIFPILHPIDTELLSSPDKKQMRDLSESISDSVFMLHTISGSGSGRSIEESAYGRSWSHYVSNLIDRVPERYRSAGIDTLPSVVKSGIYTLNELIEEGCVRNSTSTLIHRDIHLGNIMTRDGSDAVLIDLDHSAYGDQLFDLAKLHVAHSHDFPEFVKGIVTRYRERSGISRPQFYTRLRLSVVLECVWGYTYHVRNSSGSTQRVWLNCLERWVH